VGICTIILAAFGFLRLLRLLLISLSRPNEPSFFLKLCLSVGHDNCTDSTSLKFAFTDAFNRGIAKKSTAYFPNLQLVVKKTRSRKKVEASEPSPEPGSTVQASEGAAEAKPSPSRGRRKKTAEPPVETAGTSVKEPTSPFGNAPPMPTDPETVIAPAKPKRTRRVGEPKPKRYPVGEQGTEQSV